MNYVATLKGAVAARIGNTLFVHGAVDRHNMKFVPQLATRFEIPTKKAHSAVEVESVDECGALPSLAASLH
jgi:hypothetical protein